MSARPWATKVGGKTSKRWLDAKLRPAATAPMHAAAQRRQLSNGFLKDAHAVVRI
jgi:hypothetical protein